MAPCCCATWITWRECAGIPCDFFGFNLRISSMLPTTLLLGGISDSTPSEFDRVTPPGCRETKRLSELSAGLKEAQAVFTANQKMREQELAALRKRRAVDAQFFLEDPICWTQARQYLLPAKWLDLAFALRPRFSPWRRGRRPEPKSLWMPQRTSVLMRSPCSVSTSKM